VSRPVIRAAIDHLVEQGRIVRGPSRRPRIGGAAHEAEPFPGEPAARAGHDWPPVMALLPQQSSDPCVAAILKGIQTALRRHEAPCHLVVYDTFEEAAPAGLAEARRQWPAWEMRYLQRIEPEPVTGVILFSTGIADAAPILTRIQRRGAALVLVDRYVESVESDYVGTDHRAGARALVEHLLDLGHRRIAFALSYERTTSTQERVEGYRDALESRGIRVAPELVVSLDADPQPAVDALLSLSDPPTAIAAVHDSVAFDVIRAAHARGMHVPNHLSVTGFDDLESFLPGAVHTPFLTTMHQPFFDIGYRSVELLLRRREAAARRAACPTRHILLPASLVARGSTAPPARFAG
jgi:DNA-binding LacI/PurR family transcriptional regulator